MWSRNGKAKNVQFGNKIYGVQNFAQSSGVE